MLFLIGSIVLSSYLTLAFKACERLHINVFQAIVFNYLTCVVTGSFVDGIFPFTASNFQSGWIKYALMMGCIFIFLFNIIGLTTQKLGVAVASVANKLSLVIPFIFSIYLYNEKATALKITGIIIALAAVIFTCFPSGKNDQEKKSRSGKFMILLPAILFIGSGLLDTYIKYAQEYIINDVNRNPFFIMAFASAATIGVVILLIQLARKKMIFQPKAVLAGICIGIPNYFSIWCLVQVLNQYAGKSSAIIPINNMGIVLFSAVMAGLIFRERLTAVNWLGIGLAIGAIALIAFG